MFRKFLLLFFSVLLISCASNKNKSELLFDQKFKECTDEKYDRLANQSLPIDTLLFQKENIHSLLENELIIAGYLDKISKEGYLKLFENNIHPEFFKTFESKIGFDPDLLFPINSYISCYGNLYHRLKLYDEDSWQFKFGYAYNQYEAYGNMKIKSNYLKEALKQIPERKFKNIIYRKVFLDLLYTYYEQTYTVSNNGYRK
ncbi:hypothetical protein [Christiangramia salexigens]|nr:hypothetical protein [Christiangramia salexigens]